jgi:hypothetical protein
MIFGITPPLDEFTLLPHLLSEKQTVGPVV